MATRDEFLEHLWTKRINAYLNEDWIGKEIEMSLRYPNAPFADIGPVLGRWSSFCRPERHGRTPRLRPREADLIQPLVGPNKLEFNATQAFAFYDTPKLQLRLRPPDRGHHLYTHRK